MSDLQIYLSYNFYMKIANRITARITPTTINALLSSKIPDELEDGAGAGDGTGVGAGAGAGSAGIEKL